MAEDVFRHDHDGRNTKKQNDGRQHVERVRKSKRETNDTHLNCLTSLVKQEIDVAYQPAFFDQHL